MNAKATTVENFMKETRVSSIKIQGKKNILTRLHDLVESGNCNRKILASEKWINRACRTYLAFSAFYFILILILR